jgi:membrane-bound serine protease (ClpP class)
MTSRHPGKPVDSCRRRIALVLLGGSAVLALSPWVAARAGAAEEAAKAEAPVVQPAEGGKNQRRVGHLMKVSLPVTGDTYADVRRFVRRALDKADADGYRAVLIFQFVVKKGQSQYGRGSEYGACSDLARFLTSTEVGRAQTVAYVPDSIQGHAVLVAMACNEIIMAPEAEIGSAGIDEKTIEPFIRGTYRAIAERYKGKHFPVEVALAMLDPSLEVLEVKTQFGMEYVSPEGLQQLRAEGKLIEAEPRQLHAPGQPLQFTGEEARRKQFIDGRASNPREVARALELPPEAVEEDAALRGDWVAVGVRLTGPIDHEKARKVQRMIEDAVVGRGVNLVVLWIDSAGGSASDSIELANFLGLDLKRDKVHTVAYVPEEARSGAALIALACDQVVVQPRTLLGGPGAYEFSKEDIRIAMESIRSKTGTWRHRSWSLVAAMIDPNLEVYRYTREGDEEFFCEDELKDLAKEGGEPQKWIKGELVTTPGRVFRVSGSEAKQYRLADDVVEDFMAFQQLFGLKDDLELVEPGWAEFLIDALSSPAAAGLLLTIGFFAMYIELHTPGIGIGGFVAAVCFLLFFWSRFLGGTAGWLEALLFVAGLSCLLLEIFVLPGFGVFGLGGGLLVIASLLLASQTFVIPRNEYQFGQFERSLWILAGTAVGVFAAAYVSRCWLPRAPVFNRMFLEPPLGEEADTIRQREALVHFQDLVGARGTTTTQLTPGGKARFGNKLVDVMADGEMIERGTDVVVVEVHGNRVLVRLVEES